MERLVSAHSDDKDKMSIFDHTAAELQKPQDIAKAFSEVKATWRNYLGTRTGG